MRITDLHEEGPILNPFLPLLGPDGNAAFVIGAHYYTEGHGTRIILFSAVTERVPGHVVQSPCWAGLELPDVNRYLDIGGMNKRNFPPYPCDPDAPGVEIRADHSSTHELKGVFLPSDNILRLGQRICMHPRFAETLKRYGARF